LLAKIRNSHAYRALKEVRGIFALLLFPLLFVFSFPALADNTWVSYTNSGFPATLVMYDPTSGASCPGPDCAHIRDFHAEVVCPNTDSPSLPYNYGLVRRIMPCIKETLLAAANNYVGPVVQFLGNTVAAASVLSIVLLGALMVGGRSTAMWRDSLMLAAKLGGVSFFMSHLCYDPNYPGSFAVFPMLLDMMDDMVTMVSLYALQGTSFTYYQSCLNWTNPADVNTALEIWDFLDCTGEMLLGGILSADTSGSSIEFGIMGFLFACLVSKGLGITIGMIGFYLIVQLLWAVVRVLYMYITAYLGVALCIIIAPFFIPTLLFNATKSYFVNWTKALGGFMLQPIIIVAYLGMLLSAFDIVIFTGQNSLTRVLVGNAVDDPTFMDQGGIGRWMYSNGMYANKSFGSTAVTMDPQQALPPQTAPDYGAPGKLATTAPIPLTTTVTSGGLTYKMQQDFFSAMGITNSGAHPSYMGVDIPVRAIDWDAVRSNIHSQTGNPAYYTGNADVDTNNYLLDVLKSAVMAFLVAYIFLQMLDVLPFLGSGLAMGSSIVGDSSLNAKTLGAGNLAPPGADAIKNIKGPWN